MVYKPCEKKKAVALLRESIILPPELLTQIEKFIEKNKQLGFMTKEEFIRDAARWRLRYLTGTHEYIEVHKDKHEKDGTAIKEVSYPTSESPTSPINKSTSC